MKKKRNKITGLIILVLLTSSNFFRLKGNGNIRPVQYLSLLTIGALTGLLLHELIVFLKERRNKPAEVKMPE